MKTNVIITADDLGISPGANKAICEACAEGHVSHASLLSNGDYFDEAVSTAQRVCPELILGAHLNLTYGKSLVSSQKLTRKDGTFKNGFVELLLRTPFDKQLLSEIEEELDAQLARLERSGIVTNHIDSHRHVHMIPGIFKIVSKLARKHNVSRIRVTNESFFRSLRIAKGLNFLWNGGIVKLFVLKFLSQVNRVGRHKRFFSVLYTGEVSRDSLQRILFENQEMEVAVHPGDPEMDTRVTFHDIETKRYRCSKKRSAEFQACLTRTPSTRAPGQQNRKMSS